MSALQVGASSTFAFKIQRWTVPVRAAADSAGKSRTSSTREVSSPPHEGSRARTRYTRATRQARQRADVERRFTVPPQESETILCREYSQRSSVGKVSHLRPGARWRGRVSH